MNGLALLVCGHRMTAEPLRRAVELLAEGDWQQAHEIVQKDESLLAARLHGIVHTPLSGEDERTVESRRD